jgi:L-seryl-tRNA(Ser) seleniumtransferase
VSRGELVEIGGSFRVPEIMARSGARMREVGATNRTHPADYKDALGARTGLILKVHRSNFSLQGFTAEVGMAELAGLAREAGVPVVHDLGSGALMDLTTLGLPAEPTARQALEAGADVVTLSGDKLLGGPQAGILLGRSDLIDRIRRNPLCRAMRCDKLTLAALEATLALYRDPDRARHGIPVLAMLGANAETLARRASELAARIRDGGGRASTAPATSAVGGGAMPGVELPTTVVVLAPGAEGADGLARRLREASTPVVARVRDGAVLLDPRTVDGGDEDALVEAVVATMDSDE